MTSAAAEEPFCTQSEAARRLGIDRKTLGRMIRDGQLDTVRIGRRQVVRRADIDNLLQGRT